MTPTHNAEQLRQLVANLASIVRTQNGNQHADINALLEDAGRFVDSPAAAVATEQEDFMRPGEQRMTASYIPTEQRLYLADTKGTVFIVSDTSALVFRDGKLTTTSATVGRKGDAVGVTVELDDEDIIAGLEEVGIHTWGPRGEDFDAGAKFALKSPVVLADALDAARWRAIRPYLKISDVGDEDIVYALTVRTDDLEVAAAQAQTARVRGVLTVDCVVDNMAGTVNVAKLAHRRASTALQRYREGVAGEEAQYSPLERLRFFCSQAMNGRDWLDVEPFFDAFSAFNYDGDSRLLGKHASNEVQKVLALVDEYWTLAYAEGQERRTHDTPDGAAQKCLSSIELALRELARLSRRGACRGPLSDEAILWEFGDNATHDVKSPECWLVSREEAVAIGKEIAARAVSQDPKAKRP